MTSNKNPNLFPRTPQPLAAPARLIDTLRARQDALAIAVTDGYFARHPECNKGDVGRIRRLCHEDMGHHLDSLLSALSLGDARPFADYIEWLRGVLEHRGFALSHLSDALRMTRDWIKENIRESGVDAALALLEHGIALLQADHRTGTAPARDPVPSSVADHALALLAGSRGRATEQVMAALAEGASLADVSVDLVQPALYEIGRRWQENQVSVAQEHLATATAQSVLLKAYAAADFKPPNGHSAVFACVEGNHHGVGLRMVGDAFEVMGWEVDFLGTDVPTAALIEFAGSERPDLLGLSVALSHQVPTLRETIGRLRVELGTATPSILIGGRGLNALSGSILRLGADLYLPDARAASEAAQTAG